MTSAFSVLTCAILTWICMLTDTTKSTVYSEVPAPNWQSVGIGFGILAFQFGCHPAILTIQTDMNNKTQLSQSVLFSFFSEFFFHPFVNCISEDFFNYHKVVKDFHSHNENPDISNKKLDFYCVLYHIRAHDYIYPTFKIYQIRKIKFLE